MEKNEKSKGLRQMATQLQPTPDLYGQDAKDVINQIYRKQTKEDKENAEKRRVIFAKIKKRGLR